MTNETSSLFEISYLMDDNETASTSRSMDEIDATLSSDVDLDCSEELPWLIWLIVGIGVLAVIGVVSAIVTCIVWNKKKVIRRGSASDVRIVGVYNSLSQVTWPWWMVCCPKSVFERREQLKAMRQNSASNLDPYKRPPLPPINSDRQYLTVDGYQGGYVPPQRLPPIRLQSNNTATPMHTDTIPIHNNIQQDELFGIRIAGIKGVPVIEIPKNEQRHLPTPTQLSEDLKYP
ncbi:unnamed protein product [Anisakis simplex]|uniref:Uncharacterized protein n=1 Tax=Anisakis simplex TaxID=6269 RepID=A0A0M3IZD1_ANISI|nr:unnamed protein product [Anisakis simplex]